jgi:HK97 family phage prohead protease
MANKTEFRTITGVQLRAEDDSAFALEGVAAAYDEPSGAIAGGPDGNYTEVVSRGAFARSLREGVDVKALFNHDASHILGRLKNKTLRLIDTAKGLAFRVQLNPKSEGHNDIYRAVRSGLIDECSFAFTVPTGGDTWSRDYKKRTLKDVNLLDISVVTSPAYTGTSVQARSAQLRGGVYRLDWRVETALRLAKLDAEYEKTLAKLEGK